MFTIFTEVAMAHPIVEIRQGQVQVALQGKPAMAGESIPAPQSDKCWPQKESLVTSFVDALRKSTGRPRLRGAAPEGRVSLPLRWDECWPKQEGLAVFVLDLPRMATDEPLALYIPRAGNQVEINLLSGKLREKIIRYGTLNNAGYDAAKGPLWVPLPGTTFGSADAAPKQLEIKISAQRSRYAGLSEVYLGTVEDLRPKFLENYRWRQTTTIVIVLSFSLMGFIAAGIWWQQRDMLFGVFALASIMGMIRMADRIMPEPLLPWPLWGAVAAFAFSAHLLLLAKLAIVVADRWVEKFEMPFKVMLLLSAVAAGIGFIGHVPVAWTLALAFLVVVGAWVLGVMVRSTMRKPGREVKLILCSSLLVVSAGIRDFVTVRLAAPSDITYSVLPIADFLLVLSIGWIIVERYSVQVRQVRSLNNSLEERISARELDLRDSYDAMRQQAEQNATLLERARIMRDIHDGVGAQLVGLINAVKRPKNALRSASDATEVEKLAGAALDELRMAVDALQPVEGDLATVMATLRYRLQPRLTQAGIEVEWLVEELPKVLNLTPRFVLDVQRILLEALTNVIRHANAGKVTISGRVFDQETDRPNFIRLSIEDNGRGIRAPDQLVMGHGLKNMAQRADTIGAILRVTNGPSRGTLVTLEWPLSGVSGSLA